MVSPLGHELGVDRQPSVLGCEARQLVSPLLLAAAIVRAIGHANDHYLTATVPRAETLRVIGYRRYSRRLPAARSSR